MTFSWSDFYTLAEFLANQPDTPGPKLAAYRSAISRAYYACFHCATEFYHTEPFEYRSKYPLTNSSYDHNIIPNYYADANEPCRNEIGNYLAKLRERRRRADYDLNYRRLKTEALQSMAYAKIILNDLSKLTKPSAR